MIKKIFEDDAVIVLDKPPGLVVTEIPGMLAHRLDKDTSGVLLVAKGPEALWNLQSQFKQRIIKKEYLALVHGQLEAAGRVEMAIGRNPRKRKKFTVTEAGKEAVTEYEQIELRVMSEQLLREIFADFNNSQMRKLTKMGYAKFSLLRVKPKTGRTHQIRVHLKYILHPIVSDDKYAGRKMNRLDKRWCPRMFLHAQKIGFKHPVSGVWMEIESPLPLDLKKSLSYLTGNG
ncbi:RluA family pseudouridine synthase [Candidatus Daviesbacteria bacterium]|nr:RluA family pseudouridine synthase [Candidatus Daviesbacteria bacterium]